MAKKSGKATLSSKGKTTAQPAVKKKPSIAKKSVNVPGKRHLEVSGRNRLGFKRRPKHSVVLPKARILTKEAWSVIWQNKLVLIGISAVYGVMNFLLMGTASVDISVTKLRGAFDQAFGGHPGPVVSGLGTFFNLLNANGSGFGQTTGGYQVFLFLFASLALIWALRQVLAAKMIRIRDAYYQGIYPLIPFILVLLVIGVQLVPMALGASLYSVVIGNGIAISFVERLFWELQFAVLSVISLYMLSSSLFALYIVTLPDMTPMKALRSARELVRNRRWVVLRKILFLPVLLFVVAAVIMVPSIVLVPAIAQWVYLAVVMFMPLAIHGYMYTLYRELLRD